ncbi:probable cytosolic iron-sulfur protein assembly protein Ciao1 isoform X1 [Neodiprion virginianus]|uniref:probable cytosolic iron-sulfur protein assembly protein Ciao1 isoform X1 n=1 Tax=Neodiprion fabricii TaxID=2872261 RepID=UPI001ED969A6|nr:probable cytosolic iron-sulfur protein assembly protein Ciao1 isoform X1 [Neodiprion fabricii]XP_046426030.1 probable cytosolic iron-sulfur protein assembly protein Ciao1 isoform X1 [Neodiprion fabricii]XP_046620033.1 probable cytosolic iron-sulfur protein assembly protein Ciao1 isoform X1 [Neodiprion virginianus]XP_046620034.1 probable cytosolic iron-sulfur protein assembly protein Ciao1 isoform X1 [Neodiprion virginianus]
MGSLELKQSLSGHKGRVWNVCWHPKGNSLASCGEDRTIRIWANESSKWAVKTILAEGHQRTVREVSWSPCGNYIASASFDATTAIWDKKAGQFECNVTLEGHEHEVKSVSWSRSGQLLATCSRDKSVWIWEAADDEYECASVISCHAQDVKKVKWHPHEDTLASASYDDTVRIFKEDAYSDWVCTATLNSHTSTVWSLSFDSTGNRLATCSDDKTVKIWQEYKPGNEAGISTENNESVWKCCCTLSGYHSRPIYDIDWCKLTGLIATACGDDIIRIFREDTDSNPNQPSFSMVCTTDDAHTQDVNSVQWNPVVPGQLASASDDGLVKIWLYSE